MYITSNATHYLLTGALLLLHCQWMPFILSPFKCPLHIYNIFYLLSVTSKQKLYICFRKIQCTSGIGMWSVFSQSQAYTRDLKGSKHEGRIVRAISWGKGIRDTSTCRDREGRDDKMRSHDKACSVWSQQEAAIIRTHAVYKPDSLYFQRFSTLPNIL